MNNWRTVLAGLLLGLFLLPQTLKAQDDEAVSPLSVNCDLVSNYVWRGVLSSSTPNFQPSAYLTFGGFSVGMLGSTDFAGVYTEVDWYLGYTVGSFTVSLNDYYWSPGVSYFDFESETTPHLAEFILSYAGTEGFPLSIDAGVIFWGADKKFDVDLDDFDYTKNNYSTYVELGYTIAFGENSLQPFLGATLADGMYGDGYGGVEGFGVVNMGLTASRTIKVTDSFELPVRSQVIFNPQSEQAFFVFGFTF